MPGLNPSQKTLVARDIIRESVQQRSHARRGKDRDELKYAMDEGQAWWDKVTAQVAGEEKKGQ